MVLELVSGRELVFRGPFNMVSTTILKVFNNGNDRLAIKIKTTTPKRYCVKPSKTFIEPNTSRNVEITLNPPPIGAQEDNRSKHKFMLQWADVSSTYTDDAESFWKQAKTKLVNIQDLKLTCIFIDTESDRTKLETVQDLKRSSIFVDTESDKKATEFISNRQNLESTNELGYLDSERVTECLPNSELLCSICHNVFWKPIACTTCENAFCAGCIRTWMTKIDSNCQETCPFHCTFKERKAPPLLNTLLSKLKIYCAYRNNGCQQICNYDNLENHEQICQFEHVPCSVCRMLISQRESIDNKHDIHQCFSHVQQVHTDNQIQAQFIMLLNIIDKQNERIKILEDRLNNTASP